MYGDFDFVVANEHVVFGNFVNRSFDFVSNGYKKNYSFQFSLKTIQRTIKDMMDFYFSSQNDFKKIAFLLESDYYCFEKKQIEVLQDNDVFVVGWGEDLMLHTEFAQDLYKESSEIHAYANNNWFDFVQNNPKIIQTPHFVNSGEFYFECLDNRKNIVYVAGVNYYHRKRALQALKKSKYPIDNLKIYPKIYSIMRKLGLKPDGNPILIRLYNSLFKNKLEQSKYVFTCGSGLDYPIRKFFEIPALGALLLAKPFYGAKKLGFIDGKNYIKTDYKTIVEKIYFLESDPKLAQEIVKNGQDMIWNTHSLDARAKQLKSSFELILDGKYNGSYWENGKFILR